MLRSIFVFLAFSLLFLSGNSQDNIVSKEFLLGQFDYTKHQSFDKLKPEHSNRTHYVQKQVKDSIESMFNAAKKEGIYLKVISATRNYSAQKAIWDRKWKKAKAEGLNDFEAAQKILLFSSHPGTSRHHWGTDIDINSVEPEYFETERGKKEYKWLVENAAKYGFCQVYSNKNDGRTGYEEEKWHWSFLPLANRYFNLYKKYLTQLNGENLDSLYMGIGLKKNYVLGINQNCLHD